MSLTIIILLDFITIIYLFQHEYKIDNFSFSLDSFNATLVINLNVEVKSSKMNRTSIIIQLVGIV